MDNSSKVLQKFHLMQAEKLLFFAEIVFRYQQPEAANLARSPKEKLVSYSAYSVPLFEGANELSRHSELILFNYNITSSVPP